MKQQSNKKKQRYYKMVYVRDNAHIWGYKMKQPSAKDGFCFRKCNHTKCCDDRIERQQKQHKQELRKLSEIIMEKQDNILELNKQFADQKDKNKEWLKWGF